MYLQIVLALEAIRDFMDLGGDVLFVIAIVTFAMWSLIIERIIYLHSGHRVDLASVLKIWHDRPEHKSWYAHRIRESLISQVSLKFNQPLLLIKALVAVCPLLGLLGTVTGMIDVFEVMAISGSGNARAMAEGVSKATVPTMAGMVAALSGVFMSTWLQRVAIRERQLLSEHLTLEDE